CFLFWLQDIRVYNFEKFAIGNACIKSCHYLVSFLSVLVVIVPVGFGADVTPSPTVPISVKLTSTIAVLLASPAVRKRPTTCSPDLAGLKVPSALTVAWSKRSTSSVIGTDTLPWRNTPIFSP